MLHRSVAVLSGLCRFAFLLKEFPRSLRFGFRARRKIIFHNLLFRPEQTSVSVDLKYPVVGTFWSAGMPTRRLLQVTLSMISFPSGVPISAFAASAEPSITYPFRFRFFPDALCVTALLVELHPTSPTWTLKLCPCQWKMHTVDRIFDFMLLKSADFLCIVRIDQYCNLSVGFCGD